jgi:D-serine deaminase-like pyridoxal phosphate-dependent protein
MREPSPLISEAHERVREIYGSVIGRPDTEAVTPALVVDRSIVAANLAVLEDRLPSLHAGVRGHIKTHKSPHIARMQLEHGAFGLCTATIWEAIVMWRAGADDILIANQLVDPTKRRAAARLAREVTLHVNVDDAGDAEALSAAAVDAGSELGVLVEVDTGMGRSGVDDPDAALRLARRISELPGLRMDGLSGYEGHCSLEMDRERRHALQQEAMAYLVGIADLLEGHGIPCPILSAAGTATAFWTGSDPRITELQLGSYAAMDSYHVLMEPTFRIASYAVATVISRHPDRLVLDLGRKTLGAQGMDTPDAPRVRGHEGLRIERFDEEHAILAIEGPCDLRVGDVVRCDTGYTPFVVNYFDAYHVTDGGPVVDIWPIMPRGPQHAGLLSEVGLAG